MRQSGGGNYNLGLGIVADCTQTSGSPGSGLVTLMNVLLKSVRNVWDIILFVNGDSELFSRIVCARVGLLVANRSCR